MGKLKKVDQISDPKEKEAITFLMKKGHKWKQSDTLKMWMFRCGLNEKNFNLDNEGHVISLDLSKKNLNFIPRNILFLPHLRSLKLNKNHIRELSYLQNLESLEELNLDDNPLETSEKNVLQKGIISVIEHCKAKKLINVKNMSGEELKTIIPPKGNALVYIVRPQDFGGIVPFKTFINNQFIGVSTGQRFFYKVLEPGNYTFRMESVENSDIFELRVDADKTYFIKQKIKWGVKFARVKIGLLDEAKGRRELRRCKLIRDGYLDNLWKNGS
ncbi:MAG: DUF2846 domain-containing protein [Promethearchaeota archaeon]